MIIILKELGIERLKFNLSFACAFLTNTRPVWKFHFLLEIKYISCYFLLILYFLAFKTDSFRYDYLFPFTVFDDRNFRVRFRTLSQILKLVSKRLI